MELVRIKDRNDSRLETSMKYYACSFPLHEQRELASQTDIMRDSAYHFTLIFDGKEEIGTILYWETDEYIYVEHFYIYPDFRGNAYGSMTLRALTQQGKPVILEIDPPTDEISVRRKGFYERCGFAANAYPHIHPPYHKGNAGHSLVMMSYPNPISQTQYDAFQRDLKDRIMAKVF